MDLGECLLKLENECDLLLNKEEGSLEESWLRKFDIIGSHNLDRLLNAKSDEELFATLSEVKEDISFSPSFNDVGKDIFLEELTSTVRKKIRYKKAYDQLKGIVDNEYYVLKTFDGLVSQLNAIDDREEKVQIATLWISDYYNKMDLGEFLLKLQNKCDLSLNKEEESLVVKKWLKKAEVIRRYTSRECFGESSDAKTVVIDFFSDVAANKNDEKFFDVLLKECSQTDFFIPLPASNEDKEEYLQRLVLEGREEIKHKKACEKKIGEEIRDICFNNIYFEANRENSLDALPLNNDVQGVMMSFLEVEELLTFFSNLKVSKVSVKLEEYIKDCLSHEPVITKVFRETLEFFAESVRSSVPDNVFSPEDHGALSSSRVVMKS